MSARKSVYVNRIVNVNGGESPNAYMPAITVEIRVFYPPVGDNAQRAADILSEVAGEALDRLRHGDE